MIDEVLRVDSSHVVSLDELDTREMAEVVLYDPRSSTGKER